MATLNDIQTKIQRIIDKLSTKTITGTLPLTFTTNTAGAASDWEIRGNDEPGTENVFDGEIEQGTFDTYGEPLYSTKRVCSTAILVTSGAYTITLDGAQRSVCYVYDTNGNFLTNETYGSWRTIPATYNFGGDRLVRFAFSIDNTTDISPSDVSNIMLVKGSTAPDHFIPSQQGVGELRVDGYYVPLTISQAGQPDKNYDIYIGSSPLTAGQSVSKTSTGVDIELFEGENTISTTLYNKPVMEIKYK